MLEMTRKNGMQGMSNGMVVFQGQKKEGAIQAVEQAAVRATCRDGRSSHQAEGLPVEMNLHFSSGEKK